MPSPPQKQVPGLLAPFLPGLWAVAVMGIVHFLGVVGLMGSAEQWAVWPRYLGHFQGLFLFHFRHADMGHLFSNAVPLVVLTGLSAALYPKTTPRVWLGLVLMSGPLLWLWGRTGSHIGASALVYGWFHFLLGMALWRRDRQAIAGMLVAMFLYGSLFWAFIAPQGVSWEGHVAGAIAGHILAWHYRLLDPKPPGIIFEDDPPTDPADDPEPFRATRPRDPDIW